MTTSPKDPRLFELFSNAIRKGLEYVRLAETGKTFNSTHKNWPEIEFHENGLPYVTGRGAEGPKNYSETIQNTYSSLFGTFSSADGPIPDFEKEPEFIALAEYVETQPRLRDFLMYEKFSDFSKIRLMGIVGDLLDRYIHTNDTLDLKLDELAAIYLPVERCLFEDSLSALVVVPI